ncbi:UvrD-helicase domain-containing protein [Aliiroseovarius sp.]|uniref:UvrD-helicase domain-containing protein n=1 Tax=Aliiroseovarius sp. TaxID=1872442 RepID=UPI003BAAF9CA
MLEQEVKAILDHVEAGNSFLLSGGAGSGKTYSLVGVIEELIRRHPTSKIACMTYTNAAANEISERIAHTNLDVGTIHDFLWNIIKNYQVELKKAVLEIHNDQDNDKIRYTGTDIEPENLADNPVQYREYVSARKGIISHDEVIAVAKTLFGKYPKLSDVAKSMYPYVLVDEYQDTSPDVVKILLEDLTQSKKPAIIGFFGDSMQSIYDGSAGDLNAYLKTDQIKEVVKKQNRRNPQSVINLANAIRNDGLEQQPSNDQNAPNMLDGKVKPGSIRFIYSTDETRDTGEVRNSLGWDFEDVENVKELNLTHNLNAPRAGYRALMEIYDKDKLLDYKKRISDYIRKQNISDDFSSMTFGQVVDQLLAAAGSENERKKVQPTKGMQEFIDANPDLLKLARAQDYEGFRKLYVEKGQLIDDKKDSENDANSTRSTRDDLIKHLFSIQSILHLYTNGKVSEFLQRTDRRIHRLKDKKELHSDIETLKSMTDSSINEVLDFCNSTGLRRIDDRIDAFKAEKPYLWERVAKTAYGEFIALFEYLEGRTPFSTQHKVKGDEFDRVFVALDNGNWTSYNFEYLLSDTGRETVRDRSRKIFYVCCTRAREELVVYFKCPSETALATARKWFGKENVECIDIKAAP